MALGDLIPIDERTLLVLGQDLRLDRGQPDVANAVVHRTGSTLVLVDTGATEAFRAPLRAAAHRLAPWSAVLLLTTHGHPDHVGNNDIVLELAREAGVSRDRVRHFVCAHDAAQLHDPTGYWRDSLGALVGVLPGLDDADPLLHTLEQMFAPLHAVTDRTQTFEELPLEHLRIGPLHLTGWPFCDNAVRVVRTQGHCAGHVAVYLDGARLLHLADEPNGPCAAMHDADQVKMLQALGWALTAVESGAVAYLSEGHAFQVYNRAAAVTRLSRLLDDAALLDAAVQPAADSSCRAAEFVTAFAKASAELDGATANGGELFVALAALAKLRDLGMVPSGGGGWTRPAL